LKEFHAVTIGQSDVRYQHIKGERFVSAVS
jgi:hypothetical protein